VDLSNVQMVQMLIGVEKLNGSIVEWSNNRMVQLSNGVGWSAFVELC
jgi:hypothetical protein